MSKIKINVGNVLLGDKHIVIQSMTTFAPKHIKKSIKVINELAKIGCEIIRVSILDEKDAQSLSKIIPHISIPLVADIHYSSKLALLAIENGANAIRINPGNFPTKDLETIINKARQFNIPIRIGVNSGSISPKFSHLPHVDGFIAAIKEYVDKMESLDFRNIVISAKSTNIEETIKINEALSKTFPYPLHIGLTEAGDLTSAITKSTLALSPLLKQGIGDTIRISINGDSKQEIIAAKELLSSMHLSNTPTLIACPTCGRCQINSQMIVKKVKEALLTVNKDIKVAIMGCTVNGLGEGKDADIGIAGGKHKSILFVKDKENRLINNKYIVKELLKEIKN